MSNADQIREFCGVIYEDIYKQAKATLASKHSKGKKLSDTQAGGIECDAQKEAIKKATIEGLKHFPQEDAAAIWRSVYETHVHRKSGISDSETIARVVSADQSWKKSSGHAFEEMVKLLGTSALKQERISLLLQRDLNALIRAQELHNEPRDISWLKEQIKASIFDLYVLVQTEDGKKFCFGCIQTKTSIRDRVTRDREPSMQAMASFFWSTIIVLDGDFLKNPKFTSMVNGGTLEHKENGWHGLYVFSDKYTKDRIYPVDLDFKNFKEHAVSAAKYWLTQRQWFNHTWKADR